MPDVQRTVSTLLKIDGEQQYKAAIANINREQNTLKASIRSVDEQFRGQANTMAALTEKSRIFIDQQISQTSKLQLTRDMYAKAQASVKQYASEIDRIKAKIEAEGDAEGKLVKQLQTAQENLQKAQNSTEKYKGEVIRAETSLTQINNKLIDNSRYLKEAAASANGTASSIDGYGKQVKAADKNTQDLGKNGAEAFGALAQALVAAGLVRTAGEIVDLFKQASKASTDFETSFTGVLKTVEGSPEQLAAIKEQMKALSTEIPLTADELSKIAEIAGQLGIATEDVSSFTETIAALTVSTNLSAEQAATQLARFAKITGMSASEYDNLGAVIVALGNNSAATESEIVDMGMGIAAAGKQVGMSQSQIMAYAAALTSAGMESQAGGTAISKTLIEMSLASEKGGAELEKFANVAGMSSEAFASLFKSSASDALNSFITGLASGSESAIKALTDMGITEIRQRDAILRLANSNDTLTTSINTANTAFEENTALTEEAAKFYNTTDSKIQLLKNSVNLLAITIGDQYNPAVRKGTETLTDWTDSINEFLQDNPQAVQWITGFAVALGVLALAVAGGTVIVNIAIPAIVAFNEALAANPAMIVVIALAALTAGLAAASAAASDSTKEFNAQIEVSKEIVDQIESQREAYADSLTSIESQERGTSSLIDQLKKLSDEYGGSTAEQAKMSELAGQLNSSISGLNLTVDASTGKLSLNTEAIKAMAQAQYDGAKSAAQMQRYTQLLVEQADAEYALNTARSAFYAMGEGSGATTAERLKANKAVREASLEYNNVTAELEDCNAAIIENAEVTANATEATDDAAISADGITASLAALQTEWTDNRDAALDAAEKIGGVLDTLDGKGKVTIDKITQTQEQQAQFWTDYADNLAKAKELGLDPNLLAQFSTPTEENAQLLDSIVNGSVEKVKELNQAYADNAAARQAFADASASAQTAISDTYKTFTDDMDQFITDMDQGEGAYASGSSTINSLLDGLESKMPAFEELVSYVVAMVAKLNGLKVTIPGRTGSTGSSDDAQSNDRPRHKTGLNYVPYDYYPNYADEGEAILTKAEATTWRSLKASIANSTPTAAAMVTMPRQASAQDISNAVGSAVSSIKNGTVINSSVSITTPKQLSPYEIFAEERRARRKAAREA